jgi:hypothetical protein
MRLVTNATCRDFTGLPGAVMRMHWKCWSMIYFQLARLATNPSTGFGNFFCQKKFPINANIHRHEPCLIILD